MNNVFWLVFILAVSCVLAEVFMPGLILLPIGLGLLVLLPFTLVDLHPLGLALIGATSILVSFVAVQKFFRRGKASGFSSNVDQMIGKEVLVIEAIDPVNGGYIKLYGDQWKALSRDSAVIPVGAKVRILAIEGNKVIIQSLEEEKHGS